MKSNHFVSAKKLIALFLTFALALSLCSCNGCSGNGDSDNQQSKYPTGLYIVKYFGDENGQYVEDYNTYYDFSGNIKYTMDDLWENNNTIWCNISENGTGTYSDEILGTTIIDFNTDEEGTLLIDGKPHPYVYDPQNNLFWFKEEKVIWTVMESCKQEDIDKALSGMGGSVSLEEAEIGDLVCFGKYDIKTITDDPDPLFWRVIDKDDDKLLLLTDKLIGMAQYNESENQTTPQTLTWENSTLRKVLNDPETLSSMFTDEELAKMQTTHLENKSANDELMPQWSELLDSDGKKYSELAAQEKKDDPATDDKLFILSYQEVVKYFGEPTEPYPFDGVDYPFSSMKSNSKWNASVTPVIEENGEGYYNSDTGFGAWLTRTLCYTEGGETPLCVYITSAGQVLDCYAYDPLFLRLATWVSTK
ncbi:MAG: hypothetical protein IKS19_01250 [Clostridia bacterium]|nr:hypothetical protein [Clostridia bacterium]